MLIDAIDHGPAGAIQLATRRETWQTRDPATSPIRVTVEYPIHRPTDRRGNPTASTGIATADIDLHPVLQISAERSGLIVQHIQT